MTAPELKPTPRTLEGRLAEFEKQPGAKVSHAEWNFIADMRHARAKGVGYGWMQQVIEWEWQNAAGTIAHGPEYYERELAAAQARAVPEGFVAVPKASTPEMERTYRLSYARYITDMAIETNQGKALKAAHQYAYAAMITAAPTETGGKDDA